MPVSGKQHLSVLDHPNRLPLCAQWWWWWWRNAYHVKANATVTYLLQGSLDARLGLKDRRRGENRVERQRFRARRRYSQLIQLICGIISSTTARARDPRHTETKFGTKRERFNQWCLVVTVAVFLSYVQQSSRTDYRELLLMPLPTPRRRHLVQSL